MLSSLTEQESHSQVVDGQFQNAIDLFTDAKQYFINTGPRSHIRWSSTGSTSRRIPTNVANLQRRRLRSEDVLIFQPSPDESRQIPITCQAVEEPDGVKLYVGSRLQGTDIFILLGSIRQGDQGGDIKVLFEKGVRALIRRAGDVRRDGHI